MDESATTADAAAMLDSPPANWTDRLESLSAVWSGVWALWARSLRIDARRAGAHLFRLFVLGAVYTVFLTILTDTRLIGAPGLRFFSGLAFANLMILSLGAAQIFGSVITEEKEDGTLPLLLLTGISPLVLLLGKSSSRMLQVCLLVLVQLPMAMFAVILGGVTTTQILAATVAILAYVVLLANVGLLASVLATRRGDASGAVFLFVILYGLIPPIGGVLLDSRLLEEYLSPADVDRVAMFFHWWFSQSVYYRLSSILATGFNESALSIQVALHLAGAAIGFALAWWVFPWATRNLSTEALPRRLVARTTQAESKRPLRFLTSTGRAWSNPVVWQSFQFQSGGFVWITLRFIIYGCFGLFMLWGYGAFHPILSSNINWHSFFGSWCAFCFFLLMAEAIVQVSRVFQVEYQAGTWSTLRTLPWSIPGLAWSKVAGVGLSLLPAVMFAAVLLILSIRDPRDFDSALQEPVFWFFVALMIWLLNFVCWLSAYRNQAEMASRIIIIVFGLFFFWFITTQWELWRFLDDEQSFTRFWITVFAITILPMYQSICWQLSRPEN